MSWSVKKLSSLFQIVNGPGPLFLLSVGAGGVGSAFLKIANDVLSIKPWPKTKGLGNSSMQDNPVISSEVAFLDRHLKILKPS